MSKRIFISHAVNDKDLVEIFVDDLLNTGMDISSKDIFCSSLSGMGIPSGQNFIEYIKNQIQNPDVVIVFFSKSYIKSQFCMSELGATWVLAHNMLPIIVPPLTHADLKGVLTGIQVDQINVPEELSRFMESLKGILNSDISFSKWERKRSQFITKLPEIFINTSYQDDVSFEAFSRLEKKYNDAQEELSQFEKIVDEKDEIIEHLRKCKDSSEVNAVLSSTFNTEEEKFESLIIIVNTALNSLPNIVTYVLYKELYAKVRVNFNLIEDKYLSDQAVAAYEEQYLRYDEPDYYLNNNDLKIIAAISSLQSLEKFLSIEISEYLYEKLTLEFGYSPTLINKRFWKEYFIKASLL